MNECMGPCLPQVPDNHALLLSGRFLVSINSGLLFTMHEAPLGKRTRPSPSFQGECVEDWKVADSLLPSDT